MRRLGEPGPAGLEEWSDLSEKLVRGLVHALNNRVTALSAFGQLLAMGDDPEASEHVLPGELAQLSAVSEQLRTLFAEKLDSEALEIMPVIAEAVALHRHHPTLRAIRCDVTMMSSLWPVRAPRWALLRLILVLTDLAKRDAEAASQQSLSIGVQASDELVIVHWFTGSSPSAYADDLAELCGATVERCSDECRLVLPTLPELRRRERAARAGSSS